MKNRFVKFIVTCFYIGHIPIMPGTFGSLLAFPLSFGIFVLSIKFKLNISVIEPFPQGFFTFLILMILACILLFVVGVYFTNIYIKNMDQKDPKEVVIDELVGQMLTITLSSFCNIFAYHSYLINKYPGDMIGLFFHFLLPFLLFRLFDILKPWPIDWLDENVQGGIGVMIDDIAAAIFASVACYAVTFMIIGENLNAS